MSDTMPTQQGGSTAPDERLTELASRFGQDVVAASVFRDNRRLTVSADKCHAVMAALKADGFDMLVDVAGVDYLTYPDATDRYAVVYNLLNTETGERLVVKTFANDPTPEVQTVTDLWAGANWMEREIFDLFGVRFRGHPDLRRILMPEQFQAFPLRKDYPLRGRGERHNLPVITRTEG